MKAVAKPPVVYIVFRVNKGPKNTQFGGFITRLKKSGQMPKADFKPVAILDMTFVINGKGQAKIYDTQGNALFEDASFVYLKSWEGQDEKAAMIANYLHAKGVPYEDAIVGSAGKHKPSQIWKLWSRNLSVIPTIISDNVPSKQLVEEALGAGPYIVKPQRGEKGRGVELHKDYEALTNANLQWDSILLQPFIANEGDWRVLVYGYDVRGALYRKAAEGAVVNNTSQGATSTFVEARDMDDTVSNLAVNAAAAIGHAVAGVDIVVGHGDVPRILEVNQGSQIVTGGAVPSKIAAFGQYLHEVLEHRYPRKTQNPRLPMIGRYVHVNLPELKAKNIFAKVDTGAYQSAVHATDIQEVETPEGMVLEFTLLEGHTRSGLVGHRCQVKEYERTRVKNSFGIVQNRYIIKTRISIKGRMMKTGLTLTDRKDMVAPLLLGRRFLRGRYVVNVELSRLGFERSDQ